MRESKLSIGAILRESTFGKFSNDDMSLILLASVLDHILDQIFLLNGGRTFYLNQKPISHISKEDLFIEDPIFDQDTGKPYDVAFNEKKVKKMGEASVRFAQFCASQKEELMEHKTYQLSRVRLTNCTDESERNERLFAQEKSNFIKMNALKETLLTETRDSQQQIQNLCEILADINDENQIILFRDMLRCRYVKEWEKSRSEQNLLLCRQKEKALQSIIDNYRTEIDKEMRINAEIEMFVTGDQEKMESKIEDWMEKFDKETESRNIQIEMLKEKIADQAIAFNDMKLEFEEHRVAIVKYLEHKDRKRIEAEYHQMLEDMATRIQAWWRGLMVRLKLGPFNPKKGKKGKKGKDKKSNKKK